ncbi:MAG: hypothetical protein MUP69_05640 [Candidatus Atribacteria bacterium]|nr:hypothetical protein [Candidatus Atribacteria bacterium]
MNFKTKAIALLTSVAGALGLAGVCGATYITLPEGAVATLTGYAGTLFTDLWLVIALVIGIPLAFYVIRKVISLVRMH